MNKQQKDKKEWLENSQKFDEIVKKRAAAQLIPNFTPHMAKNAAARANIAVEQSLEQLKRKGNQSAIAEIQDMDKKLEKFLEKGSSFTSSDSSSTTATSPASLRHLQHQQQGYQQGHRNNHGNKHGGGGAGLSVELPARLSPRQDLSSPIAAAAPKQPMSAAVSTGLKFTFNPFQSFTDELQTAQMLQLENEWSFYYDRRGHGSKGQQMQQDQSQEWENKLTLIGTCSTVYTFWTFFNHISSPDQIPMNSNIHFFKKDIKPMWEDPANAAGGKWTISLPSSYTADIVDIWNKIILSIVGETLDDGDYVNGAVFSRRPKTDKISVWVKGVDDPESVLEVGTRMLKQVPNVKIIGMDFKSHAESMQWTSSKLQQPSSASKAQFTFEGLLDRIKNATALKNNLYK